jgi:glycosyltransferase involved in cell wall biosynthesis
MAEQLPALADDLVGRVEGADLVISHYWDGGILGAAAAERMGVPHLWVPHSLGALKRANTNPATWGRLRLEERIEHERGLIASVDGVVSTSSAISDTLRNDYGHEPRFSLPPGVDEERYHPRDPAACTAAWGLLAERSGKTIGELRARLIVTEISRTDTTKRKDVLIRAFAEVRSRVPEALLVVAIDEHARPVAEELHGLIDALGLGADVITVESVWEQLPSLYGISHVYCTPSVMEGWGMSAQEAAATAVPVVASALVPFAVEVLLGPDPHRIRYTDGEMLIGDGAVVVPADSVNGFAEALRMLLTDPERRRAMGEAALARTVPHFSWLGRTKALLDRLHA